MNKPIQTGLMAGIVAMFAIAGLEAALASIENDFFQFCTTKAYGWPAPWKIEYCECENAGTVYPASGKFMNAGAVAGGGAVSFAIFGGFSLLIQRKRYHKANKARADKDAGLLRSDHPTGPDKNHFNNMNPNIVELPLPGILEDTAVDAPQARNRDGSSVHLSPNHNNPK